MRARGQAVHRLAQLADHAGDLGVRMRVVARPDDAIGADQRVLGGEAQRALVGVEGDPALALEVLGRLHLHLRHVPREDLVMVIEALEPGNDPAAVRLEEDHLQARKALEGAAADQHGERGLHVEHVRQRLAEEDVLDADHARHLRLFLLSLGEHRARPRSDEAAEAQVAAGARQVVGEVGVEAEGQVEVLQRRPQADRRPDRRRTCRRRKGSGAGTRPPGRAPSPVFAMRIARSMSLCTIDRDAEEARRRVPAVIGEPAVVGVALRLGEVESREARRGRETGSGRPPPAGCRRWPSR